MITTKTKDGTEILINTSNITFAAPTRDNGTVVHFTENTYKVIDESFDSFKSRFAAPVLTQKFVTTTSEQTVDVKAKDFDEYPEHLPRLPTGSVDKRTTAYKEYIASL
jgi:hypothetical protein